MHTWAAPFAVAAVVAILYFFPGGRGSTPKGRAMAREISFYYACILVTAVVSTLASLNMNKTWVDTAAWVVAVLAIGAAVARFKMASEAAPAPETSDRGPLERASDRKR